MKHGRILLLALLGWVAGAVAAPPEAPVGWRGDGTGIYENAQPPVEWSRRSKGIVRTLLTQTTKPAGESTDKAQPIHDGVIRQWLLAGPFAAKDANKALDEELLAKEDQLQPDDGDKAGDAAWKSLKVIGDKDDANAYNTVVINWVNWRFPADAAATQVGYAHAYVFAPQAGTVKVLVDHAQGLKVYINGKEAYNQPKQCQVYGAANNDVYWLEHFIPIPRSASFKADLAKGWNRVLFKCAAGKGGCQFNARFFDADPVEYQTKNILWTAELPGPSNAMPVIAGDKVFVTSEPDELICLNKSNGQLLWKRSFSHYDTLTDEDRKAHPVIAEKIDPLVKQLNEAKDPDLKLSLRKQIRDLMISIDKDKYALQPVKHLPIVGYTTPTPCSDGKNVYVISANGVAACFDLEGKSVWVRHAHPQFKKRQGDWCPHGHPGSPVLIDGKFIFHLSYLVAIDAKTGKELWRADTDGGAPAPDVINGSLWATHVGQTPVVMTARGLFYNATDGKPIWECLSKLKSADAYTPTKQGPLFLSYGRIAPVQMPESITGTWGVDIQPVHGGNPGGGVGMQLSSPLCYDGLVYSVNMSGWLTVAEAKTGQCAYRKQLDLEPYIFWNGAGVCASLALAGGNIYAMDNRGNTIVFKPGQEFKQVARNTIEHDLPRRIPDDQQELTQSTPAFDGKCIYIRGEQNLYCIGAK